MQVAAAPDVVCTPMQPRMPFTSLPENVLVASTFSPDETLYYQAYTNGMLSVFETKTFTRLSNTRITMGDIVRLACTGSSLQVYVCATAYYRYRNAFRVEVDPETLIVKWSESLAEAVDDMAVSPDASFMALRSGHKLELCGMDMRVFYFKLFMEPIGALSDLKIVAEPGRSDGVVHVAVGVALRVTRLARYSVLALQVAPHHTAVNLGLLRACGDGRVLNRVLRWLL